MPEQQGYPDFRRRFDHVGELFANNVLGVARTGNRSYGPFYVGDMDYLLVGWQSGAGNPPLQFTFTWTSDQASGARMGQRRLWQIDAGMQLLIPNLGRWATLVIAPETGATNWTDKLILAATNRGAAIEAVPLDPLLIAQDFNLGPSGVVRVDIAQMFAGGAFMSGYSGDVTWTVGIEAMIGYDVWTSVDWARLAGGVAQEVSQRVVMPLTQCRLYMSNTSAGVGVVRGIIVPSTSGGG